MQLPSPSWKIHSVRSPANTRACLKMRVDHDGRSVPSEAIRTGTTWTRWNTDFGSGQHRETFVNTLVKGIIVHINPFNQPRQAISALSANLEEVKLQLHCSFSSALNGCPCFSLGKTNRSTKARITSPPVVGHPRIGASPAVGGGSEACIHRPNHQVPGFR